MFSTGEVLLDCASVEETSLLRGECELGRGRGIDVGGQGGDSPQYPRWNLMLRQPDVAVEVDLSG